MATARDRHYDTRSARLVTRLGVALALPQPCKKMTVIPPHTKLLCNMVLLCSKALPERDGDSHSSETSIKE